MNKKGFSVLFFVIITSTFLMLGLVSLYEWQSIVRDLVVRVEERQKMHAATYSCAQRALMWSENTNFVASSTYKEGVFSCFITKYTKENGKRTVKVEVQSPWGYVQESYSVAEY